MKFAVYQDEAVLGIGASIEEAMEDAGIDISLLMFFTGGCYSANSVVDMTGCMKLSADDEAASGASAKVRKISDDLCLEFERNGDTTSILFFVNSHGVLEHYDMIN